MPIISYHALFTVFASLPNYNVLTKPENCSVTSSPKVSLGSTRNKKKNTSWKLTYTLILPIISYHALFTVFAPLPNYTVLTKHKNCSVTSSPKASLGSTTNKEKNTSWKLTYTLIFLAIILCIIHCIYIPTKLHPYQLHCTY